VKSSAVTPNIDVTGSLIENDKETASKRLLANSEFEQSDFQICSYTLASKHLTTLFLVVLPASNPLKMIRTLIQINALLR